MSVLLLVVVACHPGSIPLDPARPEDTDTASVDTGAGPADTDTAVGPSDDSAGLDADGDGVTASTDCDDTDPAVSPGAQEVCNDIDDDCDGLIDGQDPDVSGATAWYADDDGDGRGDPEDSRAQCSAPSGYVANSLDCDDTDPDDDCTVPPGDGTFHCLDLSDDVNRDHTNGPWTDNPSESFDVRPGTHAWVVSDGTLVDFVVIDPDSNGGASLILTKGGEDWRPSYSFPEVFTIDGEGASGTRLHVAGLASGWSDPSLFSGVAATLTVNFADGTQQVVELANGTNMDDWNHTWHSVSDADAVRVYEDTTYGRHIDALTVALSSAAPIDSLILLDDETVHTGTAEKTSVAIFAITIE